MVRNLRRQILVGCGAIGLGCLILFGCIGIYFMPQREIPAELPELLVEPWMAPGEWELADGGDWEPIPERAVIEDYHAWEGVIRVLRRPEPQCKGFDHTTFAPLGCDIISHKLLRYGNEWQARVAFSSGRLPALTHDLEWWLPEGWTYPRFKADQFRFGCTKFQYNWRYEATLCTAAARYGPVISIVTIRVFTNRMGLEEIKYLLREIDEHIAYQLDVQ